MRKRKSAKSSPKVSDEPADPKTEARPAFVEELELNAEEAPPVEPDVQVKAERKLQAMAETVAGQGPVQRMTTEVNKILEQQVQGKMVAAVMAAGLVAMIWIYQQIPGPPLPPDKTVELALQAGLKEARVQVEKQQKNLQDLTGMVAALTEELKQERGHTQARFQEVSSRLAEALRQKLTPTAPPAPASANSPSVMTPEGVVQPTEALGELLLLKERNRLTDYADKAIATGSRDALQAVVEAMFDPERQNLHHAAQAEFRRVQAFYEISASIDPAYKLPLLELFKDGSVKSEAEIKPLQLMALMKDSSQPWEVRLRCAYLLRESPEKAVNPALLQALKEDASLDVAKQAQTSLERRLGKRFRLFDIPAVEAWMLAHPQN